MFERIAGLFRRKPEPAAPTWIEVEALRRGLDGPAPPLVIDVRGGDEFDGPLGHIEGARNIPLADVASHIAEIAAARRAVVCVCLTDKRSAQAAATLAAAGLRDVAVLRGGMKAWREAP